ncbi:glycerophosphodiester phosphodiesterase [Enterococcus quebecensis]|uniref:Glycerophosphodiester phosphodiesterase n=1 Tax=Enterococcus quebecensis TaxID=903983 RepID=A0A1E5GWZ8_9ENTE|nr:glycerophosphodiester phosphodiesterase [Enterococcus quebecensis]OEG17176.1 glycerophosphodiester phosphodiesterase [Enterococcus quebecensis]
MTKIIAHRGSKGTHPENTLAAFKEAIHIGADGIELDVHLSKDNELIVIHDETVDRTTNGHGEVNRLTLEELKQLDAGSWFEINPMFQEIPTLVEVLLLLKKENFQGLLNIEIKTDKIHYEGIEALIVQLMKSQQWTFDYMYSSFNFKSLEIIWEIEKSQKIASIFEMSDSDEQRALESTFIEGIHPNINWVLKHEDKLIDFPKAIRPWTVNNEEQMIFCFNHQLAGIHTDFPGKALQIRELIQNKG